MSTRALLAAAVSLGLLASACGTDSATPSDPDAIGIGDTGADGDTTFPDVPVPDAPDDVAPDVAPDVPDDTSDDGSGADIVEDVAPDIVPDVPIEPPASCEVAGDCNDGLTCTNDTCEDGICRWAVQPSSCLINRVCRARGEGAANDPCLECNPGANAFDWSERAAGAACDDGNECTVGTVCTGGLCLGEAIACSDGDVCTVDSCDPALGCVFEPGEDGIRCDDGSECTLNDVCTGGVCGGEPEICDDSNDCTSEVCDDELGCVYTQLTGPCDDGDACTDGDTCVDGACVVAGPTNCDDGNTCTIDFCDEFAGCAYLPNLNPCCTGTVSICDDLDPCTNDNCDPASGSCDYSFNTARCDDLDACTSLDSCTDGECAGTPVTCDDRNPCTEDSCDPELGCRYRPLNDVACDDGVACTFDDVCSAGRCVAGRDECVCEPTFGLDALRITAAAIGDGGRPGQALDLDRNPATCAPNPGCSGGAHNALSPLAAFANAPLADAIADGSLTILLDFDDIGLNPFAIALFTGELDPGSAGCDITGPGCGYLVSDSTLDRETCVATVSLPATRAGTNVTAGGPGAVFPFEIPLGDSVLTLTLYNVRFEGTITLDGGRISAVQGVLGGAVPKTQLIAAIESLPADALPIDPASIVGLLNALVQNDIDSDGNGSLDAASIGLVLSGVAADLTGVDR
jgi:hypothetical protein